LIGRSGKQPLRASPHVNAPFAGGFLIPPALWVLDYYFPLIFLLNRCGGVDLVPRLPPVTDRRETSTYSPSHAVMRPRSRRVLGWLVRLLLIPILAFIAAGMIRAIGRISFDMGRGELLLVAASGFAVGVVAFSLISPFISVYVLGHELTHWLIAKLFRRRTDSFTVGNGRGSVRIERPNVWIVLSPYFLPLYTVIWIILCFLVGIWHWPPWMPAVLYFGVGITYAFHAVLTGLTILRRQPDLKWYGPVFSLSLIIAVNVTILFWGLVYCANDFRSGVRNLHGSYSAQWQELCSIVHYVRDRSSACRSPAHPPAGE